MMKMTRRIAAAVAVLMLGLAGRAEAGVTIDFEEVGPDVVVTGSGSLDLAGLTFISSGYVLIGTNPGDGIVSLGGFTPNLPPDYGNGDYYQAGTRAAGFGLAGGGALPTTGSGDIFGFEAYYPAVIVPQGYISGTSLSATNTYANETFSSLDLTPGTYVYTLPNDTITVQIGPADVPTTATPEPSTLAGAALAGLVGLAIARRRRQAA